MRYVVAGAIIARESVTDRRLLLAQRSYPADVAGKWELPGGKVEDGETREQALVRELAEELGVRVSVGSPLAAEVSLREDLAMIALRAHIIDGSLRATEHHGLRWVNAQELATMHANAELVPADEAWVPELVELLADGTDVRRPEPS